MSDFGVGGYCLHLMLGGSRLCHVWDLEFEVWGLGVGVRGLGFGVRVSGFGVWGLGFGVWALKFMVRGLGFRLHLAHDGRILSDRRGHLAAQNSSKPVWTPAPWRSPSRSRVSSVHLRQPGLDSGPGFQVKFRKTFQVDPVSLDSDAREEKKNK